MPLPVRIISAAFALAGLYLGVVGLLMLASPGVLSMASGAFLLGGFETSGPYMFQLGAAVHLLIAVGLWRGAKLAARAAFILAAVGVLTAVPAISGAAISARLDALLVQGIPFVLRVVMISYLLQPGAREAFQKPV